MMGGQDSGGDLNPNMDYAQHNQTYGRFLTYTKIGIVLLVLLLGAMRYFLVP
jgi:Bacterial aa3 type cytochrome c oxidase subunit IV